MTSRRLPYMPSLDGVRAIAVLAVVWYHAGALGGGWIGVEVFFVLSGYLITALLIAERDATGTIDLVDFWRRRARRLLPGIGLLVVLVAAYVWRYGDLRPSRSIDTDLLGLLTYSSNWTTLGGDGYWQQFDAPSPLRHAWSLAVEEQFYLIFPVLGVAVLGRAHRTAWLAALAVVAVAWQVAAPAWFGVERVYLGTDTRAFGLLAGAALAAVAADGRLRPMRSAPLGLLALGVLAGVLGDATATTFRGPFQLVVAATLLVLIDVTTDGAGATARALSWPPLVSVGRWSYGIYLFHWPIMLAAAARFGGRPWLLGLVTAAITIPFAGLSYRFVEGPIRAGRLRELAPGVRRAAPLAATSVVVVIAMAAAATAVDEAPTAEAVADRAIEVNAPTEPGASTNGLPAPSASPSPTTDPSDNPTTVSTTISTTISTTNPTTNPTSIPTSEPASSPTTLADTGPDDPVSSTVATSSPPTPTPQLVERPDDRPLRIYVAGDSLGESIGRELAASAGDLGIEVFTRAAGGCGFDRERMQYFNADVEPEACRDLVEAWRPDVLAYQPDAVIVAYAGWWGWFRDGRVQTQCEPELAQHVRNLYDLALDDLHASGAPVYFISPANWEGDPVGPDGIPALFDCVRELLADWVDSRSPAARLVDVAGMLCRGERCDATIDGSPVRPDRIHFSGPTAPAMMTAILAEMVEPPPQGWIHQRPIDLPA